MAVVPGAFAVARVAGEGPFEVWSRRDVAVAFQSAEGVVRIAEEVAQGAVGVVALFARGGAAVPLQVGESAVGEVGIELPEDESDKACGDDKAERE